MKRCLAPTAPSLLLAAALLACRPDSGPARYEPGGPAAAGNAAGAPAAGPAARSEEEFARQRREMVKSLEDVVKDRKILDALGQVPRHEFIPPAMRARSYANTPLQILESQTISQPDLVAIMTEALALRGDERVLEIGTGSGYQAAVLGELVPEVYTVEIRPALAENARRIIEDLRRRGLLHYRKLEVIVGDGFQGYPAAAPYDAIIVTAAPQKVPTDLINQLKPGGRMVIPVGDYHQELQLIRKREDGSLFTKNIQPVRFVPMVTPGEER